MSGRRWFNSSLPQTLQIANILLYLDAFFLLINILGGRRGLGGITLILLAASVAAYVLGGLGLANEEKRGYPVAVVAAFSPFILRAYLSFQVGVLELGFILGFKQPLSLLFEVALIGLLLHTQSKSYVKTWFH
ncbi:MAG: hypothetical protein IPH81_08390 [Candidatus Microthrix sp.]|jgi:hypothetical protein|nr:hypothetical protein [Candidatus Microthrix sp.]MBK6309703.1 hypothetical protein [Candidatus Microthrix sp.]MBK6438984.1 hypothetical protein [Candidatus Microthrix sp.]MBK7165280.1 hypothetical protein [Candidatus Microthrix sp.]MBK9560561.1 hypothetical protein [Candidatus Microthrix sp.]MBP7595144.1 hypothetical protein [Candidatus Microthrix sp.]